MKEKTKKPQAKKPENTVEDRDFLLYNDRSDEQEVIEALPYNLKDRYIEEGSGWGKFYD